MEKLYCKAIFRCLDCPNCRWWSTTQYNDGYCCIVVKDGVNNKLMTKIPDRFSIADFCPLGDINV